MSNMEVNELVENIGSSPRQIDIVEYTNSPDPYDSIVKTITHVRKESQKKHKTRDFVGVVLDYDQINMSDCELETHEGFSAFLGSQEIYNKKNISVYRIKVLIPEFEGYLPTLSLGDLEEYHKIKRDLGENKISENDPRYKTFDYCRRRIHRFKTFYSLQEAEPKEKAPIKVSFIDDNYFYGIVTSVQ